VNFIRSLVFNIFIYLGVILACTLALPLLILPSSFLRKLAFYLGKYFIFLSRYILNTKVNIEGKENLKETKTYFIASEHQSMFETFVFNSLIPNNFFILKKELLNIPLYGQCLKKMGCVPIQRGKTTKENINFTDDIKKQVSKGNTLIIFPQGTRIPYGQIVPLKKGVGRIYSDLNIACIPVKLDTGKVWPKNSFLKYPGKINIRFEKPINPGLEMNEFMNRLNNIFYN